MNNVTVLRPFRPSHELEAEAEAELAKAAKHRDKAEALFHEAQLSRCWELEMSVSAEREILA